MVWAATKEPHRFEAKDLRLMELVADRCGAAIEHGRLDEAERRSRLGVEHARLHLALLARAGDLLSTALDSYDDALRSWPAWSFPSSPTGSPSTSWTTTASCAGWSTACGARGGPPSPSSDDVPHRHPQGERLVRLAMAKGRPEVVMNSRRDRDRRMGESPPLPGSFADGAPAAGVESMLIVPIRVRGLSFGALSFVTGLGRRGYRRSDLETAQGLAERVGVAVERVLAWGTSRAAESTATRYADRLQRLMEAALVVNAPLAEPEVLRVLADHAQRVLGAQQVVVSAAPIGGEHDRDGVAVPRPGTRPRPGRGDHRQRPRGPVQPAPTLPRVSRPPCPTAQRTIAPVADVPWLAVPLSDSAGMCQRVIVAVGKKGGLFTAEDESVLTLLAEMASVRLRNAHLYQAVEGNEHRLRTVVDSSPLAIAELDLAGDARWWNRAAEDLFGWDSETSVPKRIPVRTSAETVLSELWERARAGHPTLGTQIEARGGADELIELSVSTGAVDRPRHGSRHLDGGRGRHRAAPADGAVPPGRAPRRHGAHGGWGGARLQQPPHRDPRLQRGAARRLAEADPAREDVAAIQRAGQRAAALTSQLLAIGHRRALQPAVIDVDAVVKSMEPMLGRLLGEDVELELVSSPIPAQILADSAELERALLNLAINARDAMPSGGRFTISTRVVGQAHQAARNLVAVSLSDTGSGMDAETAEHCFEPFFTTKGLAQGTGLGLATVHAAVTQAGGDVSVETAPGHGTTFTLWFPADDGVVVPLTTTVPGATSGQEVILLVEDEEELGRLAVRELEERGYTVVASSRAAQAIALAQSRPERVDLLVTDVVMPGMSGIELAAVLTERYPGLPVLFVSGHLDSGAVGRHPLPDAADLLAKPFTPNQLAMRVRDALDRAARSRGEAPATEPTEAKRGRWARVVQG